MLSTTSTRKFVPQEINVADFSQIEPLYRDLLARSLSTESAVEQFLLDFSELCSVVEEFGVRRYIDKSCHTDDAEIEKRYLQFVEEIEPKVKPLYFALQKKLLESPAKKISILERNWRADVDLFREANVPLETQVTKLVNEYDKIFGVMTVTVDGKEITIPQAAKYFEEPDRAKREQVWRATIRRRLSEREKIDAIFDQLIPLRQTIAHNSGLPDYRAYCWKQYKRFDYTPKDCFRFADAIAATCVPLVKKLDDERAELLAVDSLRPWDMNVDIHNRPPLRPFDAEQVDQFVTKTKSIFERLSPELATQFESLRTNRNLDLDSRKGKQPGGYQSSLEEVRQPFIFMNASGMQDDVETLLHEGGHAFHYIAARQQPLVFLRSAPMEFCEVASMAMELFGSDHLDIFYAPEQAARARRAMLEGVIRVLPWIAAVDSFQHWLYENPAHTREQRTEHWSDIVQTFGERIGINIDWTGFEDARDTSWQRQLHLFHVPFYYIEYGIAQLGALQLWMKALEDPRKALANYRAGLALGGTRTLPELFAATGISFDFSEKTLRPLMLAIQQELALLPA
jgi:oligoendopeptidase F